MSAAAPAADLTIRQQRNARTIYREGRAAGLSRERAIELVVAAWNESRLDETAVNPSSGAAGLFQLLSEGYRSAARRLGGLFNPTANTRAILPDYVRYWRSNPRAAFGEAARDVERSGEGADYYRQGRELFGWLNDRTSRAAGGATASAPPRPFNLAAHVRGDVDRVDPDLLARLWLLGLYLGRRVDVGSGYRSNAEQQALYARWVAGGRRGAPVATPGRSNHEKGQAADAQIGGRHLGDVVDDATLRAFGLKVLRNIGEPWHVEPIAKRAYNPEAPDGVTVAERASVVAAALPAGIGARLLPKLRQWLRGAGRGAGRAAGTAGALGILAGLGVVDSYSVKWAALWLLLTLLGLGLVLAGVLRLVGASPADVVNVTVPTPGGSR